MLILTKGKIYDSDDAPVLILFTSNELEKFKAEPPHVDIKCSFPPEWTQERGEQWMNENRGKVIKARDVAMRRAGNVVETQVLTSPAPAPVRMTDGDLSQLIDGLDPESIEFDDDENEGVVIDDR